MDRRWIVPEFPCIGQFPDRVSEPLLIVYRGQLLVMDRRCDNTIVPEFTCIGIGTFPDRVAGPGGL